MIVPARSAVVRAEGGRPSSIGLPLSLPRRQWAFLLSLDQLRHYGSASEVIREALRLLEERDRPHAIRLEEPRKEIKRGLDSGEPTPLDIDVIKARGRKRLAIQQRKVKP